MLWAESNFRWAFKRRNTNKKNQVEKNTLSWILEKKIVLNLKRKMSVDPLSIDHISELVDKKSWKKYKRYWLNFCSSQELSIEKPPTPNLVLEFLKICQKEKEYAPTTMWTVYSCLNKFCQHLYDLQLNVSSFKFQTLYLGILMQKVFWV